jgi:hypothetical protein
LLCPHYQASSLIQDAPPLRPAPVLSFSQICCLNFSRLQSAACVLDSALALSVSSVDCNVWTLGSHVPCKSLCQARAAFMPDTAWAVNRLPSDLSRVNDPLSVSMSLIRFRHFISGSFSFTFLTSPDAIVRAFSATFTTLAFTSAACGGLKPPPVRRLRRAFLHHLHSTAFGVMYSTYMSHLLRSWHTVICIPDKSEGGTG